MKYAGFWKRFVAVLLDWLVLLIPLIALNYTIPYAGSVILALIYYPVFESSVLMATPGKYWMGIRVTDEQGQQLTFGRAVARFFLKYLSAMILLIGYIMQAFTAKRQALHDLLANTIVTEVPKSTISPDWFGTWMDQMRYILRVTEVRPTAAVVVDGQTASSATSTGTTSSVNTHSQAQAASAVESIEKLYELYKNGVLTEDEFQAKKAELLKQV